jgi:hypothetical protein
MYFDGQLSYFDKDKPSSSRQPGADHPSLGMSASTAAQQPASGQGAPLSKSQSVAGAAGDLHSMALKSAISNIGTPVAFCAEE